VTAGMVIENEEDLAVLQDIEKKVIQNVDLGFDPEILDILDNADTTRAQIEALRELLSKDIVIRLFSIGNSIHYGRLRAGRFANFADILLRMGMEPAKITILSLAFFFMNREKEFVELSARSFLISILGRTMARQMGLADEEVKQAELGGLFLKVGKIFMLMYLRDQKGGFDQTFITRYHRHLGLGIVKRFKLPAFLNEVLRHPCLSLKEGSIDWPGIVSIAHSAVDQSFKKYGRMVLQSPMPDADGVVSSSLGSIMADEMNAVGLGQYLEIIPSLSRQQQMARRRNRQAQQAGDKASLA
jgi:hypothetical protein